MTDQKICDIDALEGKELVIALSSIFGPTGCEDRVSRAVKGVIDKYCDRTVLDRMGNLIGKISLGNAEKRKKIMLSAHLDEVGFMIEQINDKGMLTFDTVGGIDPSVLAGKNVLVGNEEKLVRGVICSKAIHHKSKSERAEAVECDKLYIDLGLSSKEEAENWVSVGDFATFDLSSESALFGKDKNMMRCKALDDRMGCAALIEIMKRLRSEMPDVDLDVYFCFTVREETGYSGAEVVANRISPDFAFIFESTAIGDIPTAQENKRVAEVSRGAVISIADRSTIYDKELIDLSFNLAKRDGIPLQVKRYLSGGNDAGHIHKSGVGVRSLAISVPTRYLHSATCVAHYADYLSAKNIGYAVLCELGKIKIFERLYEKHF